MAEVSQLISKLNEGHQNLINIIEQIKPLNRSYIQSKPKLLELEDKLFSHLGFQNEEFYGIIRKNFNLDIKEEKIIEFLVIDLKDIKVKSLMFFDKYSGDMGNINSSGYFTEIIVFSQLILGRIKTEKDILIPILEEIIK